MKQWMTIALLILALVLAGCSGGDDEPSSQEGDAEHGAELFQKGNGSEAPPCTSCHKISAESSGLALGPLLEGIADKAATRVDGLGAEEYIRQSILDPQSYVVSGYRVGMYSAYSEHLSEQDIADLIAYLMSL